MTTAPRHGLVAVTNGPNRVIVGWLPCQCVEGRAAHRTYYCRECGVTMYEPSPAP